ncbi:MAG TPA: DUF4830 domain-containing protein [Oscillospiraceae bacterium]|nr:DUF4830 domain-containing protein [Oscillospiraceae bacterium]HPS34146.1 DUF4830 domain-containing protein [Oscillospiraceae bacterium]
MMVWSFKLNKKILAFALILIAAVIVVILIATGGGGKTSEETSSRNNAVTGQADLVKFIKQFGWEIEETPEETIAIYIPKNFDTVLERYNTIQKNQGYDLTKYRGEKATRYTFVITNYPGVTDKVVINVIVRNEEVIGGDVCCKALGGFMHGFSPERAEASTLAEVSLPAAAESETAEPTVVPDEVVGPSD